MDGIKVSIVCIAYNHEKYIREALDSFLEQKTDFGYEIIVHDDASTDKTPEIIQDYERRHPDIIQSVCQKENQFSKKKNFQFLSPLYNLCKGKYIAFCDGDDFWIDRYKLQLQVNFLEEHPDFILTVHNALRLNCSDNTIKTMDPFIYDKEVTAEEIIMLYHGMVPTASMVMRAEVLKKRMAESQEKIFQECGVGDWPVQLYCLARGRIYYFSRIMSVYRLFHEGAWSKAWSTDFNKRFEHSMMMTDFLKKYNQYTDYAYNNYIINRIQRYIYTILETDGEEQNKLLWKKCEQYDEKNADAEELKRLFMLLYDENYKEERLKNFSERHRHVLIFGAGDYAARLTKQLERQGIIFDGYAVSEEKGKEKIYLGKPVWELNNIPFISDGLGIIVGIKPVSWNQLADVLEKNRMKEYICPFLFDIQAMISTK